MITSRGGVGSAATNWLPGGAELISTFGELPKGVRSAIASPSCMKCPTAAAISSVAPAVNALPLSTMNAPKTKPTFRNLNFELGHT
jgi:hypothetical protein